MNKQNLNVVSGTYSNCLTNNLQTIYSKYEDKHVSTEMFRTLILDTVEQSKDTPKKQIFVNNVKKLKSKDDLVMYVANTTLRAEHLSANPDDKWSNEK